MRPFVLAFVHASLILSLAYWCPLDRRTASASAVPLDSPARKRAVPREASLQPFDPYSFFKGWRTRKRMPVRAADKCAQMTHEELSEIIEPAAREEGIDPDLISAMINVESASRPCMISPKGAQGLMQLMPATARALHVENPFNPRQNIAAGARLLKMLLARYHGNLPKALAAYNAGPARVDRAKDIPAIPETRSYLARLVKGSDTTKHAPE